MPSLQPLFAPLFTAATRDLGVLEVNECCGSRDVHVVVATTASREDLEHVRHAAVSAFPGRGVHVVRQSPAARTGRDFWSALGDDAPPLPGVSPRAASVAPPALAASELEPGWFRRSSTVCIAVVPERERAASERDGAAARGSVRPPRG